MPGKPKSLFLENLDEKLEGTLLVLKLKWKKPFTLMVWTLKHLTANMKQCTLNNYYQEIFKNFQESYRSYQWPLLKSKNGLPAKNVQFIGPDANSFSLWERVLIEGNILILNESWLTANPKKPATITINNGYLDTIVKCIETFFKLDITLCI